MDKALAFQKEMDCPVAYGQYSDLIADPEVDVIYIGTPHHLHYPLLIDCIKNGKNVLCEKPICINADQLLLVKQLAEDSGVFVMEALWTRFLPAFIALKEYIDNSGQSIKNITADFCFPTEYNPNSRLYNPDLAGGSLLDIGIYPLFLSYFLLGKPNQISVTGEVDRGVDLRFSGMLDYGSGITSFVSSDITCASKNEAVIKLDEEVIVIPERWHESNNFNILKNNTITQYFYPKIGLGYYHEIDHVQDMLTKNKVESSLFSLNDSLELMKIMDKVRSDLGLNYPMAIEEVNQ
ncbi:Gfo/Idh/MocA family oxidoreductase [Membranihabitans marinus]